MNTRDNRPPIRRVTAFAVAAVFFLCGFGGGEIAFAEATNSVAATNGFPDLSEVFQGRVFTSDTARDVFLIQQVRRRYPNYWAPLLAANITFGDYVLSPEKMRRFVEELGVAVGNSDDPLVISNLAAVVTDPNFYTNAPQPALQQAVAHSLIELGPNGRHALAGAFDQTHYRLDPESLETLANAVGKSGVADTNLSSALAVAAFTFTATNGGSYPQCTRDAAKNLLCLTNGIDALRPHLNTNEMFADPGRFQSVVDGISDAHAAALVPDLKRLDAAIRARLPALVPPPDPYRADLTDLQSRIERTVDTLHP